LNRDAFYPIQSFTYQFNQSIESVLKTEHNPNTQVLLEAREDIELEDAVIQVKYHEKRDYSPSEVKRAVQLLYDGYSEENSKKAILLCHFKNKTPGDVQFTSEEILQNFKIINFTQQKLDMFSKNFILRFDTNFEENYGSIIEKIKDIFLCESSEEAEICYSWILTRCLYKIINNPAGHENERYITFEEIYENCPNNKKTADTLLEKINSGEDVTENLKAQIEVLRQKAKTYFFSKLRESEQGMTFIQDSEMEKISDKLE